MPTPKKTPAKKTAAKKTEAAPKKRSIDWAKYGARSAADAGDTWKAVEEGDTLTGRLKKIDEVTTRFGEKVVIEFEGVTDVVSNGEEIDLEGAVTFWPTPGAIDALSDAEAELGDEVTITLVELVDTGKGNPAKVFEAEVV